MKSRLISLREPLKVAGFLRIVAPLQWFILVFVAQAFYPSYSITKTVTARLVQRRVSARYTSRRR